MIESKPMFNDRDRNKRLRKVAFLAIASTFVFGSFAYIAKWLFIDRFWVTTDNAFVTGNLVPVYSDASGVIIEVAKEETQYAKAGDLLIQLDQQRAKAAVDVAEGELGRAVRTVSALFATRNQMCDKIRARQAILDRVNHDVLRYKQALPSGSVSKQVFQNAEDQRAAVGAELQEARAEFDALDARLTGTTPLDHPEIKTMKGKFLEAYIEMARQSIRAPVDGFIAKRKAQVGDRVKPGAPLMTLVPLDHLWVEANLWESSLKNVRPGQPAIVIADVYGRAQVYHGKVEGLVPGTGSVFALLPPDNATGNFIHIVQRVPVRIGLDQKDLIERPLRPGLSTVTSIDVHNGSYSPNGAVTEASSEEYKTRVYNNDYKIAEEKAQKIVRENLGTKADHFDRTCPEATK